MFIEKREQIWNLSEKTSTTEWFVVDLVDRLYSGDEIVAEKEVPLFMDVECENSYCQFTGNLIDKIPIHAQVNDGAGMVFFSDTDDGCVDDCINWIKENEWKYQHELEEC